MPAPTTRTVEVPGAVLTYDVREPSTAGPHRPLLVFGSPMAADGFAQLVPHLADRTVVTVDPRVSGRSVLDDDTGLSFEVHADDAHRVVEATGLGPVDVLASSGAAVVVLPWALAHADDLGTVVAHEPPLVDLLEDRDVVERLMADVADTYDARGHGAAMAKFVGLVVHEGPFPEDYLDRPDPDPADFGFSAEDDGRRDDALLGRNLRMPPYRPDGTALRASGVRILPAVGASSTGTMPHRGGLALATLLGVEPVTFPGDHGGFMAGDWAPDNDPAAFAARLRAVLEEA